MSDAELPITNKVKKLREKNEEEDSLNETDEEKVNVALQHLCSNVITIKPFHATGLCLYPYKKRPVA